MRQLVFIFSFVSFSAQPADIWDILKNQDHSLALQKELKKDIGSVFPSSHKPYSFIKAFEGKNFEKALNIWLKSVKSSPFAKSSTGSALYAYLLFQNGFEVLSLQHLLSQSQPVEIDPIVKRLWTVDINKRNPVWSYFFFSIPSEWHGFFPAPAVFELGSKALSPFQDSPKLIESLLKLALDKTTDVFSVEWAFVLNLIKKEDMDSAAKILAWLLKKTKDQSRKDKIHLTIGRLLADRGETDAALYYYGQLKKPSYFWLLAQEEKAWLFLNSGNYGPAYSTASVFEYPQFKKSASPYMFLALARSQLKNCDYKGTARSLSYFKSLFSKRGYNIEKALKTGDYNNLRENLLAFYSSGNPYYGMDDPHLFYHIKKDSFLKSHILLYDYMNNREPAKKAKIPALAQTENEIIKQLERQMQKRMRILLQREIKKINSVLTEFQIIETEALYRVQGFHALSPHKKIKPNASQRLAPPFLYFPFNPNEIWLDELSAYQSYPLKGCPKKSYIL